VTQVTSTCRLPARTVPLCAVARPSRISPATSSI
jgi:hypothetical protein